MIAAMDDWDLDTPEKKKTRRSVTGPAAEEAPASAAAPPESAPVMRSPAARIVAALAILLVGVLVGLFIARSQATGDTAALTEARAQLSELQKAMSQSEDRNWSYYRENAELKAELERAHSGGQTSTSTTTPGSAGREGVYGDGVYVVAEDIAPGTYDGVVTGNVGYWARLKGTDGSASAIITNAIPRGPFVLTIYPADKAVELRGVEIRPR